MGIFDSIFGKKKKILEPFDMSILKMDVHSHLIPGIDDGAQTMEDSIQLIRELNALGYSKFITTPHIMSDFYKNTPEIILGGLEKVRERLKEEGLNVEISAAAEYYMDFEFEAKIKEGGLLTFGDNYVLFEVSYFNKPEGFERIVFDLQTAGYKPMLAHVERYPFWYGNWEKYERFKELGVFFQLNIMSLGGHYGGQTKKVAEDLIDRGMIDLIGSDLHNMNHIESMKRAIREEYLHKIATNEKLLNYHL